MTIARLDIIFLLGRNVKDEKEFEKAQFLQKDSVFLLFLAFSSKILLSDLYFLTESLSREQTEFSLWECARRIRTSGKIIKTDTEIKVTLGEEDVMLINLI
ncbi:MAG: hypothetical protein NC898_04940 [Candidatus Omnitrophica bacterium]|nr:hypothetical protein [Candidatus Omnitrophota bacterium]MCM8793793.1 hypothetical protein [Candidatus Omnitrophota bacterium]